MADMTKAHARMEDCRGNESSKDAGAARDSALRKLYARRRAPELFAIGREPVSYTHLDVYKRQTKSTRYIKCKVAYDVIVDGKMRERKQDVVGFEAQMIQHMIDHCLGKLV